MGWGLGPDQTPLCSHVCRHCPTCRTEQSKTLKRSLYMGRVTLVLKLDVTFLALNMPEWVNEKLLIAGCRKILLSHLSIPHRPTAGRHREHLGLRRSSFHLFGENLNFCRHHNFSKRVHQGSLRLEPPWTAFPLLLLQVL